VSLQLQQQLLAVLHELRDVAVAESNRNRKLVAAVDILVVVLEASATMANKSSESSTAVSVRNEALEVISSSASRPPCRLAGWCPSWNRCSGRPVRVREGARRAGIARCGSGFGDGHGQSGEGVTVRGEARGDDGDGARDGAARAACREDKGGVRVV